MKTITAHAVSFVLFFSSRTAAAFPGSTHLAGYLWQEDLHFLDVKLNTQEHIYLYERYYLFYVTPKTPTPIKCRSYPLALRYHPA